jgi:DNA-directed RNA polymerase specialized sigma subunit
MNQENEILKYEKYIYSILSTEDNHSKAKKNRKKVHIYHSEYLGMDFEDLLQEGRKFIIEALGKYDNTRGATKSTFIYNYLYHRFLNIAIKLMSPKYSHVESPIDPEVNADLWQLFY